MSENNQENQAQSAAPPRRRGAFGGGHGGPPGMMPGEKAKDFRGTIGKLLKYMGKYKIVLCIVVVFAIAGSAFNIVGPKILGNATTELGRGIQAKIAGNGGIDFGVIAKILINLIILYAISAVFTFVQGWLMTGLSQNLAFRFRREMSEKINRMPMQYFESKTVGEVLSRITNDVDTLGQSLNQSVTMLLSSVTAIVGTIIMMLTISPLMTLIALIMLPVSGILIAVVMKKSQKFFVTQQKYLGEINGQIEETYSGHDIVKAFNKEDGMLEDFEKTNDVLYQSAWKSQFLSGMMFPIMGFVGNLGYVGVVVSGVVLNIKGVITIGNIQSFIMYVKQLTQPIGQVAQVSNMLQSTMAAAERVFEFLAESEESINEKPSAHSEGIQGNVEFDGVAFGYSEDNILIKNFSTKVDSGAMVAIVGPTGAGKTTMVKLLMRFYDVNGGHIRVDGKDIKDFERGDLRSLFGMVLQDTWLFKGTIMENIRYGRLDATDEEVIAAAKTAHAHHFISTLPDGYNMELCEDATNVSQGQKQLLTIARAILASKRILILDEATSSVDTRTETLIQKGMANLMKGRTSFVIAHRLSTIRDADTILVMKDGDIFEQGDHESLIAKGGFYKSLYESQFEQE